MLRAELKVVGGVHDGKVIPLTTHKFLIGREEDCHLRPNSENVSRYHCVFTIDEFAVRLRDLGSTNGTILNNETLKGQSVLKPGDSIQVGNLGFEIRIREAAPADGNQTVELSGTETQNVESVSNPADAGRQTQLMAPAQEIPSLMEEPDEVAPIAEAQPQEVVPELAPSPVEVGAAPVEELVPGQPQLMPQGGYAPQPGMDPAAYPQQQMQPGYMPQQQMPGYPQQAPGYPPQQGMYPQQPFGYPQQFVPQQQQQFAPQPGAMPQPGMPYPQQPGYGMPQQQQMPYQPQPGEIAPEPVQEAVEESETKPDGGKRVVSPPVKLPPPESTGVKD